MKTGFLSKESRPWGVFYVLKDEPNFKLKQINVLPNRKLSYQSHKSRSEVWTIIQGEAEVVLNDVQHKLSYGESIRIPLGAKHRIINSSDEELIFIEVQTGTYFGEDDIIRYADEYNRI